MVSLVCGGTQYEGFAILSVANADLRDKFDGQPILPLTGLRFIAAAMIVLHHGWRMVGLPPVNLPLDQGVSFFFVLSGFILVYRYPRLDCWQSARDFMVARIARLWPVHAVTALAAIVLVPEFDAKLIANLAMVQAWVPIMSWYFSYNAVSWSISTEFFFYIAFIVLIPGWARSYWWKLVLSAALLWAMIKFVTVLAPPDTATDEISAHGLLYISPLSRLLEFVAGMATCLAFRAIAPRIATITANGVFTVLEIASIEQFRPATPLFALQIELRPTAVFSVASIESRGYTYAPQNPINSHFYCGS